MDVKKETMQAHLEDLPIKRANFNSWQRALPVVTRKVSKIQNFYEIREKCIKACVLYEDPNFPCTESSISKDLHNVVWLRPKEITKNAEFFVDGGNRFDVQQGKLGDCWFLAAVADLTLNKKIFAKVVPENQNFVENYAGIFHFRFWQYGDWIDVVVDDRLPTINGRLVYMQSSTSNEFWSALLEKAYAKLYGSYNALEGGKTSEAMLDFTGGVTETYQLKDQQPKPDYLFQLLLKAYERGSFMSCSLNGDPNRKEAETKEGLVCGHAYSITCVRRVNIKTPRKVGKIPLIRIRNPWGDDFEWTGAWSDRSNEWSFIPQDEKAQIEYVRQNDGEFWMSFDDFQKHFDSVEICNLSPDALDEEKNEKLKWKSNIFKGQWMRGVTAGGCPNFPKTFHQNPQYRITLVDPDDDDDDGMCTLIIALSQKNRSGVSENLCIGFIIYQLDNPDKAPKPLTRAYLARKRPCGTSKTYVNARDVSGRFKLPPGVYCIIPSTFEPNEEGQFVLRIFTETKSNIEEKDDAVGQGMVDQEFSHLTSSAFKSGAFEVLNAKTTEAAEIGWQQLQDILCNVDYFHTSGGFSKEACQAIVAMMDLDRSGSLNFTEFLLLLREIHLWNSVFKHYDHDNLGKINAAQLRQAINSAGYRLNNRVLQNLVYRYATKGGTIAFDDFIICLMRLKKAIELLDAHKTSDSVTLSRDDFIDAISYW